MRIEKVSNSCRRRWLRAIIVGASAFSIAGCSTYEPLRPDLAARSVPSRLDETAYINALREAFVFVQDGACYDGEELSAFRPSLEQGRPDHTEAQERGPQGQCAKFKATASSQEIERYLDAGYGLTDLYCQRYFVIAIESDRKRQFQRNSGATADALVNAVLGFAGASARAVSISNAGFEAYDSTYQNIEDAFMVSPDLALTRKLVHAAQADFRAEVAKKMPESYLEARNFIERYPGTCSYTGMKQLVNDSVASTTNALEKAVTSSRAVQQPNVTAEEATTETPSVMPAPPARVIRPL